ncbi:hypothetical protein V1525DRAFT_188209 [Lipomyces kononenkoae]|uniref:Uncharacterized protein n=1 Tax=Lipomyces kononenkoae TaxID=34357 RepID=A0ACC3T001_LIPKO
MSSRPSNYTSPVTTNSVPTNPDDVPSDPPPPYSLEPDDTSSFAAMSLPPQSVGPTPPPRPQNTRPQQSESPPKPPPRPSNNNYQSSYQEYTPPLPPRPPQGRPYTNSYYTPAANGRLLYPRGYHCEKCGNTGYKYVNGHPCRTCFERFATPQSPNVHNLPPPAVNSRWYSPYPSGYYYSTPAPGRVVRPGDPSIGGVLCGACKGRGVVDELGLGNAIGGMLGGWTTCRVCRGVGRLL